MAQRDQDERRELSNPEASDSATDLSRARLSEVDASNLRRLKHIVHQEGFPTAAMVGVDGVQAAWLVVQHADADPAFQADVLQVISKRVEDGELERSELALLIDRVRVAQGKRQLFGTQFEKHGNEWKPKPIEDEARVDERRRAMGLGSLENYSCMLRATYDAANVPSEPSPSKK